VRRVKLGRRGVRVLWAMMLKVLLRGLRIEMLLSSMAASWGSLGNKHWWKKYQIKHPTLCKTNRASSLDSNTYSNHKQFLPMICDKVRHLEESMQISSLAGKVLLSNTLLHPLESDNKSLNVQKRLIRSHRESSEGIERPWEASNVTKYHQQFITRSSERSSKRSCRLMQNVIRKSCQCSSAVKFPCFQFFPRHIMIWKIV
jgi:hypothetical protein